MQSLKYIFALIVFSLFSVAVMAQDDGVGFAYDDCPFDLPDSEVVEATIDCGYLIVPENRDNPDTEFIELAVAILYSENPQPDPIIYLEGGPGGSALAGIDAWYASPFREDRDIILIDQRGTGFSVPSLNCEEVDEYDDELEATQVCYDRLLNDGVDLAAYTTVANAADINDLINALELDEVNLYGISYGTRLALEVIENHPDSIRSVVIDSVYPQNVNAYVENAPNIQATFDALFDACNADPDCREEYPDLGNIFYATMDTLNESPLPLEEFDMTGDDLFNDLSQLMYDSSMIPFIPALIFAAYDGDVEYFLDLKDGAYIEETDDMGEDYPEIDIDADSEGLFNTIECNDEVPFQTPAQVEASANGLSAQIGAASVSGSLAMFDTCDIWQVPTAPASENAATVSDVPTLVLSGALDPITPPVWGATAAANLSNSFIYTFPGVGHGAIDGGPCPLGIGLAFIDNPTVAPDSSCIADMEVTFFIP
jgi:pimeloyl-ACP methyl ester carboxylesterase